MHARQARRGRHAFIILVASLALVIMAVFGAWAYYSGDLAKAHATKDASPVVAHTVTEVPAAMKQTAGAAPTGG
jgi:flagellar basal body-associated protein FliL